MAVSLEKQIAKKVLNIMTRALTTAMLTVDAHEGRFMKQELNLREALESPGFTKHSKRPYNHTAEYFARKNGKRIYRKKDKKYWGL